MGGIFGLLFLSIFALVTDKNLNIFDKIKTQNQCNAIVVNGAISGSSSISILIILCAMIMFN